MEKETYFVWACLNSPLFGKVDSLIKYHGSSTLECGVVVNKWEENHEILVSKLSKVIKEKRRENHKVIFSHLPKPW